MKSMVTSVMYLPNAFGRTWGFVVCKSFSRFLYWYFFELLDWWQVKAVIKSTRDLWRKGSSALSRCRVFARMVGSPEEATKHVLKIFWVRKEGRKQECKLAMSWSNEALQQNSFGKNESAVITLYIDLYQNLCWSWRIIDEISNIHRSFTRVEWITRGVGGVSHLREWNLR